MQAHATNDKDHITWEEYKKSVYGFTDDSNDQEDEDGDSYKKMIERDYRRWNAADAVSDVRASTFLEDFIWILLIKNQG